jgi:hypothetical protein
MIALIAVLDALRGSDSDKGAHLSAEHVTRALPFDCVQPFTIGICAVPPASPAETDGDAP